MAAYYLLALRQQEREHRLPRWSERHVTHIPAGHMRTAYTFSACTHHELLLGQGLLHVLELLPGQDDLTQTVGHVHLHAWPCGQDQAFADNCVHAWSLCAWRY